MDKATLFSRIESDLKEDPRLAHACAAVVRYLEQQRPEALRNITFGTLSRAAGLDDPLEALPVAQYLSSGRAHLLETCFRLIVGDSEYDLSAETLAEARRSKVLYHPDRGEPIDDFEKAVHVYFTVSADGEGIVGRAA